MFDDITDSCDVLHGGKVMHEYTDAAHSVGSSDKVISEEVADEAADRECRDYVVHVSW